ncbi:MAG: hypothetical protein PHF84_00235 [bacterium]|nr:hypothetical protein [bacterium]
MIFCSYNIRADEIQFHFNDDSAVSYDRTRVEVYNSQLRLSPTGVWTNTGRLGHDTIPQYLFQDSKSNLFYSAGFMGSPPYTTYKSSNNGVTWYNVNSSFNQMLEGSDGRLYGAFSYNGVYKSYDNGSRWTNRMTVTGLVQMIFEDSDHALYAEDREYSVVDQWATNYLYKSTDHATNWFLICKIGVTNGYSTSGFDELLELDNRHFIARRGAVTTIPSGIYLSTNRGTNWYLLSFSSNIYMNRLFRSRDGSLYAASSSGIYRSPDEARTWQVLSSGSCAWLIEANDGIFYKVSGTNLWKSFDKGANWEQTADIKIGTANFSRNLSSALLQALDGSILAGGCTNTSASNSGYVFRSGYAVSNDVILNIAPDAINRWTSFSYSDTLNNGKVSYQFSSSPDGGYVWSDWQELTDSGLQSIRCSSGGQDRLRIRITLCSAGRDSTPLVDWIKVSYDGGIRQDLEKVVAAPNPFHPAGDNSGYVVFFNLTPEFKKDVYSVGGGKVVSLKGNASAGKYRWNVKNEQGEDLKTGVYICCISNPEGQKKYLKLLVSR